MKRITKDTKIENFKREYGIDEGTERRSSEAREQQLRKFAQLRSRNPETNLRLTENPHKGFGHTEKPEDDLESDEHTVEITNRKVRQNVTDLPREYFDYLFQKGVTIHEVGHILYSDWPSLQEQLNEVPDKDKKLYKDWWNLFEDATIEKFLRDRYRVDEEIDLIRHNLAEDVQVPEDVLEELDPDEEIPDKYKTNIPGKSVEGPDGEEVRYLYMKDAISSAIYDLGIWNTETLKKLMSPDENYEFVVDEDRERFLDFLPTIRRYVDAITSEPDAATRNRYTYQFYEEAKDLIEDSDASGRGQNSGNPNGEMPDDAHGGVGEQQEEGEAESSGGSSPSEDGDAGEDTLPGEARAQNAPDDEEYEREAEKGLADEGDDVSDSLEDEIERFIDAMKGGGGYKELVVPEDNELNTKTYNKAKRQSRPISQTLEERLRIQRKSRTRRHLDRGEFDAGNMIKAARGLPDVFKGEDNTGDKDYRVVFVKDSSSSTDSFHDEIEVATGTFSMALENVGVDTCILDVESSKVQLSKPFGSSVEQNRENVFNGISSGGTPLRHAIWFARERINMGAGDGEVPFLVVLTDGKPQKPEQYREELRKCNFPVIGLYIDKSKSRSTEAMKAFRDDFDYFHNQGVVFKGENTLSNLEGLCRTFMF